MFDGAPKIYIVTNRVTTTTDLIAVTNLASNITSLSYGSAILKLIIDSPFRTTSTTQVYAGERGIPNEVWVENRTLSWSYNASNVTLTLNVTRLNHTVKILIDLENIR